MLKYELRIVTSEEGADKERNAAYAADFDGNGLECVGMEYQTNAEWEEEEIDLRALVSLVVRNLWKAIIAGILAAAVVLCVMPVTMNTTYCATTDVYVFVESSEGLSADSEVTNNTVELAVDSSVLNEAVAMLNDTVNVSTLASSVGAERISNTSVVRLSITASSKADATAWVEAVREAAINKIPNLMQKKVVFGSADTVSVTSSTTDNRSEVMRDTAVAAIAAIMVVMIVIVCGEVFSSRIKSAEEAEKITGLPVVGTIFEGGKKAKGSLIQTSGAAEDSSARITHEAYRSLRTNVLYSAKKNGWKSFLVTSSLRDEDVYGVAANLGLVMAEAGKKTLVVDCDLRSGTLNAQLGLDDSVSLASVLSESAEWKNAVATVEGTGLNVICAGKAANSAELLSSPAMEQLLRQLEEEYDCVLLVTSGAAGVTDSSVLGALASGVILVTQVRYAKADTVRMALRNLKAVNANVIGVVLTKLNIRKEYGNKAYAEVKKRGF
jgi:capsular exopolysaccharide synthesis family protein